MKKRIEEVQPKLVCFSVPFPGNLYSAFRCAQFIKANFPNVKTAMGGGFPNTELRELKDQRVFEFFDFIIQNFKMRWLNNTLNHFFRL